MADLLRAAARLDRGQSDPVVALRNAIGVAAPLAIGILDGGIGLGLAATIGALQTGFADRPGPYRLRVVRMLVTALAAGTTSGLAVLASSSDTASVALLFALALGAGLLLGAGPAATQVGIAGVAAALILGHLHQPSSVALHVGLLVFAGGAAQAVLAIAAWPLRRHRPERLALARLYRELATAARSWPGTGGPPATVTLGAVRQTLYGLGHDHGPSVEAYRVLLDEAERIRREVVVISGLAGRLADEQQPILAGWVREALGAAAGVLDEIAGALAAGRPVDTGLLDRARASLERAVERLDPGQDDALTRRAAAARLGALSGKLRAAVRSTRVGASEGGRSADAPARPRRRALGNPLAALRAYIALDSAVLRHAVRLGVLVGGTDLVVRLVGFDRGYWVSLTVLVVLRPDFASTLQRAVMRTLGTIVGLLLATALVHWIPGGGWWQVVLVGVFAFGMRFAGPGNIALTAVSLSGLVVVLLEINGVPAHTTLASRALATAIGGTLAVVASVAMPAWERQFLPHRLGELLRAYRGLLVAVADPDTSRADLDRWRAQSRRARTNAQASVDRAVAEPVVAPAEIELGRTVLAHSHRFIGAVLAVETVRPAIRSAGGLPELDGYFAAAAAVLAAVADAVDGPVLWPGPQDGPVPALRPLADQLTAALRSHPDRVGGVEVTATLADAADRITDSVNTLLEEVRRQTAAPV